MSDHKVTYRVLTLDLDEGEIIIEDSCGSAFAANEAGVERCRQNGGTEAAALELLDHAEKFGEW